MFFFSFDLDITLTISNLDIDLLITSISKQASMGSFYSLTVILTQWSCYSNSTWSRCICVLGMKYLAPVVQKL